MNKKVIIISAIIVVFLIGLITLVFSNRRPYITYTGIIIGINNSTQTIWVSSKDDIFKIMEEEEKSDNYKPEYNPPLYVTFADYSVVLKKIKIADEKGNRIKFEDLRVGETISINYIKSSNSKLSSPEPLENIKSVKIIEKRKD